jgi:hypothetical protein
MSARLWASRGGRVERYNQPILTFVVAVVGSPGGTTAPTRYYKPN